MPDGKIKVHCPACGATARAAESITQQDRKCPKCGRTVRFTPVDDIETGPLPAGEIVPVLPASPPRRKPWLFILIIGAVLLVIVAGIVVSLLGGPKG